MPAMAPVSCQRSATTERIRPEQPDDKHSERPPHVARKNQRHACAAHSEIADCPHRRSARSSARFRQLPGSRGGPAIGAAASISARIASQKSHSDATTGTVGSTPLCLTVTVVASAVMRTAGRALIHQPRAHRALREQRDAALAPDLVALENPGAVHEIDWVVVADDQRIVVAPPSPI